MSTVWTTSLKQLKMRWKEKKKAEHRRGWRVKNDLAEISTKYSNVPQDEMFYSKGKMIIWNSQGSLNGAGALMNPCWNPMQEWWMEEPTQAERMMGAHHTYTHKTYKRAQKQDVALYTTLRTMQKSSKEGNNNVQKSFCTRNIFSQAIWLAKDQSRTPLFLMVIYEENL